jgi:hypothetical protein
MTDEPNDTESKDASDSPPPSKASDTQAAESQTTTDSKSESKAAEAAESKSESKPASDSPASKPADGDDVAVKAASKPAEPTDSKSESKHDDSPTPSKPAEATKSKDDGAKVESKDAAAVAKVESKDVAAKVESKDAPATIESKDATGESKNVAAKVESKNVASSAAKAESKDVAAKLDSKAVAAKVESKDVAAKVESKDASDTRPSDDDRPAEVPHFVDPEDSYATDARRPTSDYRVIAILLAIASIACLGYSAWSRHWLYNPRTRITASEYAFGPRGMFRCASTGACEEMSNRELADDFTAQIAEARHRAEYLPEGSNQDIQTMLWREATETADMLQTSPAFVPTAWIALVSIIVTAASLLVTLALALARKRVLLPIQPTTTALLGLIVGLVAGCVFVATKPGAAGFVGVSYGFWVFGAGTVLGLAAATLLNKHIRPVDLDLLEDSMDPEQF